MGEPRQFDAIDLDTVASLLKKSKRQINNYININGLPSQGEGRQRVFIWSDVLEWYVDFRMQKEIGGGNDGNEDSDFDDSISDSEAGKKEDIRGANLRKTRADADLKELQLSEKRGEVIVIADAATRLNRMMGNLRAKLLGMPVRLANRLEGEKDRTGREAAIKEEMENLCREISTGEVVGLPTPAGDDVLDEISAAEEHPGFTNEDFGV